jgi:hypothetical protein
MDLICPGVTRAHADRPLGRESAVDGVDERPVVVVPPDAEVEPEQASRVTGRTRALRRAAVAALRPDGRAMSGVQT